MPISKIPVNAAAAVTRRVAEMQPGAFIDFGLYGGAGQENVDAIEEQALAGVVGFKTFLQPPPSARLDEFVGLWCTDTAAVRDILAATAATRLPHAFHCEDAALFSALQARLEAAGRLDGLAHAESRPPVVEERSVAGLLVLAAEARARVHVVHLSSPRSAQLVLDARQRGVDVTAETCPSYLFFSSEVLATLRGFAKCNPPLRDRDDVEGLWRYVSAGAIDVIGTDHSPFLDDEKMRGDANIFLAPPGLCGLEVALPLMLTAVHGGRLSLAQLVSLMSERAASLFRLPRKGRLKPGYDADFVLVDCAHEWTFDHTRARTKSRGNMRIYDGTALAGSVVSTFLRGRPVVEDGELVGKPGFGRLVRPERQDAASIH
jgi:dihydroorotase-like cyclic amidohydrolase